MQGEGEVGRSVSSHVQVKVNGELGLQNRGRVGLINAGGRIIWKFC